MLGLALAALCGGLPQAVAETPRSTELNNNALQEHYRGHYESALDLYNQAINLESSKEILFTNRASTFLALDRYEEALADIRKASQLGANPAEIAHLTAKVHLKSGNFKAALKAVERSIDLAPDDAFSYNLRGLIHMEAGSYAKAVADFNKTIEFGLANASVLTNRAMAFRRNKQYQDALADVQEALRMDPEKAYAREERIRIYVALNQPEKALSDYEALIRQAPGDAAYLEARGRLWLQLEQYDKAIADFTKAQSMQSKTAGILLSLAQRSQKWSSLQQLAPQKPRIGEIQLDGRVLSVGKDQFVMNASSFTSDTGRTKTISPAKPKTILLGKDARWFNQSSTEMTRDQLKTGVRISVIGRDTGNLQAAKLFVAVNTAAPPKVPENAIGRPRFTLKDGRLVRAGTAFAARLEDGRTLMLTAHHVLGESGGLHKDLEPGQVAETLKRVELYDALGIIPRMDAGAYIQLTNALKDGYDDSRDDVAAFTLADTFNKAETLTLSSVLPVPGAPVWIGGRVFDDRSMRPVLLYPATVISADEKQLLIRPEPMVNVRGLSGAPLLNSDGEVVGMVLASQRDLVICNPAVSIAARLAASALAAPEEAAPPVTE